MRFAASCATHAGWRRRAGSTPFDPPRGVPFVVQAIILVIAFCFCLRGLRQSPPPPPESGITVRGAYRTALPHLARLMGNASSARLMRNVRTGHGILLLNFLHVRHGLNARQLERRKRPRKCLNCDGLSAKPAANAGALLCQGRGRNVILFWFHEFVAFLEVQPRSN